MAMPEGLKEGVSLITRSRIHPTRCASAQGMSGCPHNPILGHAPMTDTLIAGTSSLWAHITRPVWRKLHSRSSGCSSLCIALVAIKLGSYRNALFTFIDINFLMSKGFFKCTRREFSQLGGCVCVLLFVVFCFDTDLAAAIAEDCHSLLIPCPPEESCAN